MESDGIHENLGLRSYQIDMHIQAQELHNGEVHTKKAVACCVW